MFSNKNEKHNIYEICILTVILVVLAFDAFFVSRKEGYHMDEILSYELSNSEFTPWITPTQPQGRLEKYYLEHIYDKNIAVRIANLFDQISDIMKNRGSSAALQMTADVYDTPVWMSRDDVISYVTYDKDDSVPVLSPYYNTTTDNHPPLYFILLNAFSMIHDKVFPGVLSPWTGCILNMIFMALSLLMIILIFADIFEKKYTGLFATLFYGLSTAGLSTVLLIRMYSMTAFFCLAYTYLLLKKLKEGSDFKKKNKLLILVTVLGFLTQYFVCIYYFFLTLSVMVYLGVLKEKKKLLYILRMLLISSAWGLGLYPFVFHDLLGTQVGESVMGSFGASSGYFEKLTAFFRIISGEILGSSFGFMIVILLGAGLLIYSVKKKTVNIYALFMCISAVAYLFLVSRIAPYLVDRYVMPIFPIAILCLVFIVQEVVITISERYIAKDRERKVFYFALLSLLSVFCLLLGVFHNPGYLYSGYDVQRDISERYSSLDAVVIYEGTSFYQNVPELMNYQNALLLKEDELSAEYDRLRGVDELIVIIGTGVDEKKVFGSFGSKYGFSSITVLLENGAFGDTVCLLRK